MKVVLVTGGSKGIGKQIVKKLLQEGKNVIYTYSTRKVEIELEYNADSDVYCQASIVDQSKPDEIIKFCNELKRKEIELEGVILNAGISESSLIMNMDLDSWIRTININLTGNFVWMSQIANIFIQQGNGVLITIASKAGIEGQVGSAAYASSKGGIIVLAKTFGKEMSRFGVKNYIIAPGFIDTNMLDGLNKEKLAKGSLLKRIGKPSEVADFAYYLLSSDTYFQNCVFEMDGGCI